MKNRNYDKSLEIARSYITEESIEKMSKATKKAWEDGKYENANWPKKRKPLSESHKRRISESMKKAHRENRHDGWKHINSDVLQMSRPEKIFNSMLERTGLSKDYDIRYGFSVSKYFLDFAILDLKIDIEIDGVQHVRTEDSIEHDIKRDEFMISEGWEVYRISVKELYNNKNEIMKDLILFINDKRKYRKYDINEILKQYSTPDLKYGSIKEYNNAKKKANDEKVKPIIKKLMESDIEFDKFGWVKKASNIIGISPPKVNKWMKRNMLEFYNNKCFKKKIN